MPDPSSTRDSVAAMIAAEGDWLRRVARRLVDETNADDLAQEVWLTCLHAPPQTDSARPWLQTVATNHLRDTWRSDQRRARREDVASTSHLPSAESPEDAAASRQLRTLLLLEIEALADIYREILVLRFFEDRSTPEIARILGLPPGTVRRRLKEGVDRLRASLDRQHGGRHAWMRAIVPFAAAPAGGTSAPAAPTGATGGRSVLGVGLGVASLTALVVTGLFVTELPWPNSSSSSGVRAEGKLKHPLPRFFPSPAATEGEAASAATGVEGSVALRDGRPVAGAQVTLTELARRSNVRTQTSSSDGDFTFADVPPGRYRIVALANEGFAAAEALVDARGADGATTATTTHARLVLAGETAALSGRVFDATTGASLDAVRVSAVGYVGGGVDKYATKSDASGRYRLLLPRGRRYQIIATREGHTPTNAFPVVAGDTTVDLPLPSNTEISVRLIDDLTGRPIPAGTLTLSRLRPDGAPEVDTVSAMEAPGLFRLSMSAGTYRLSAQSGVRFGAIPPRFFGAGKKTHLDLPLARATALHGRVVGGAGEGLARVEIHATVRAPETHLNLTSRATTDESGHYQITDLPMGVELELEARAPGHPRTTLRLAATALTAGQLPDLRLDQEARVEGRVLDVDGAPAAGVTVRALWRRSTAGPAAIPADETTTTISDENGRFRFTGLPAAELFIAAADHDGAAAAHGPDRVGVGEQLAVDLTLAPAAWVSGRVQFDDGSPAGGVVVEGSLLGNPAAAILVANTVADADGTFRLGPIAVPDDNAGRGGRLALRLGWRPLYLWTPRRFEPLPPHEELITSGEVRSNLVLTVPRIDSRIAGRVLDHSGNVVANALVDVSIQLQDGGVERERRTFSDAAGHFDLRNLIPGRHRVCVWSFRFPTVCRDGVEADGPPIDVVLPEEVPALHFGAILGPK
jgi:RNA polymerase sigma-70 factor, ECF subfamily